MSDTTPRYQPGQGFTCTAAGTIIGGQLVMTSGPAARNVVAATAAATNVVGVASRDAVSGQEVGVQNRGVYLLTATGSVLSGADVVAAATGTVATVGVNTFATVVGKALQDIANAQQGEVLLTL
jgi:streptogramin lyase